MQHSDLQLYHKYKPMAINFLCNHEVISALYQKRTQDVPLTNRFVGIPALSPCISIESDSGILFLMIVQLIYSHVIVLVAGFVGKSVTF